MKKQVIVSAVITGLISGAAFAQTNVVSSANVVGYSSVTMMPGVNATRMAFVTGTNAVDIQNIMDTSNLKRGGSLNTADSLSFYDSLTLQYKRYFLHDGVAKGTAAKAGKWVVYPSTDIASNTVPPTTGYFFTSVQTSNINVVSSGDVVLSATGTNSIYLVEGVNQIANPFTCEWPLNDGSINWTNQGAKVGGSLNTADSLSFWDNPTQSYKRYFLHDGVAKGTTAKAGKWVVYPSTDIASNLTAQISESFFYSRLIGQPAFTLKVKQPYTIQ